MTMPGWIAVLALVAALAPAARAEMYRCEGPDGAPLYTSDASQCPGARAHEPRGAVQTHESRPAAAPRPPAARAPGLADDEARAAVWRGKRAKAVAELERVSDLRQRSERAVGWCNRGGDLYVEEDTGLRRGVSCDSVRREQEELERAEAELKSYLGGGLEEECRRAGCLPGWVRD
jgi:hypothetical protein